MQVFGFGFTLCNLFCYVDWGCGFALTFVKVFVTCLLGFCEVLCLGCFITCFIVCNSYYDSFFVCSDITSLVILLLWLP